jgi:hypothetical protein
MAGTGFEPAQESPGNSPSAIQSDAKSGAFGAEYCPCDADLAVVVEAWPSLPEALRAGILAMIRASRSAG